MKNRYIPFGYQIQNGDSVINTEQAATVQHITIAVQAFTAFHRAVNGITACSDIYTESEFRKTGMLDGGNFGAKTREKITITRELF